MGVTIFCGECLPVPNVQPVDDGRGCCRSSANLKTVYEDTESLGKPQGLGSKPVQQTLAAWQCSLHISLRTASKDLPEVDSTRSTNLGNRWKKIFYFVPLCLIEISGICFAIYEFDCSGCLGSQWLSWVFSQKYWYLVPP